LALSLALEALAKIMSTVFRRYSTAGNEYIYRCTRRAISSGSADLLRQDYIFLQDYQAIDGMVDCRCVDPTI